MNYESYSALLDLVLLGILVGGFVIIVLAIKALVEYINWLKRRTK